MDGVPAFFYPTRFSNFGLLGEIWDHVPQQYSLLTHEQWPYNHPDHVEDLSFPLSDPVGVRLHRHLTQQVRRPTIKIKPIQRLLLSTSTKSVTDTAQKIQELAVNQRLHQVRRCPVFWQNLMSYASENGVPTDTFHNGPPMAHQQDQAMAIFSLHGWFQRHIIQKPHFVNGEPAVQDVIRTQLLDFADNILRVSHSIYSLIYH